MFVWSYQFGSDHKGSSTACIILKPLLLQHCSVFYSWLSNFRFDNTLLKNRSVNILLKNNANISEWINKNLPTAKVPAVWHLQNATFPPVSHMPSCTDFVARHVTALLLSGLHKHQTSCTGQPHHEKRQNVMTVVSLKKQFKALSNTSWNPLSSVHKTFVITTKYEQGNDLWCIAHVHNGTV